MTIYQHFRDDEHPFIDQILSWREEVEQKYAGKLTDFLHPREQKIMQLIIGKDEEWKLDFFGGWNNAERKRAYLYPYYEEISDANFDTELLETTYPEKFVTITHRDVLGAFLSVGIKRKKIGDIMISNGKIQILVSKEITDYLLINVTSIKNANVSFESVPFERMLPKNEMWKESQRTCASLRMDVLIKEIYQVSRQEASQLIKKGLVRVNFQTVDNPAFLMEEEDLISVRGKGRARIKEFHGKTKKDKIRFTFEKLQ
ncbi:RNA-binding protein YlmH [Gracilibacillus halotolerans]|uniref:RNA-binding protein YlmH n=1 Tax=Gracilibacillus halotolerans TaxID=74386 RepID=A0A841RFK9_9BACI|nr:YlmH/Sll1252 family protein [Gracilibacillus halotolerans]MBB6511371.1 RNA-binding protein YlmH [Gracilibacillus halotolerans]